MLRVKERKRLTSQYEWDSSRRKFKKSKDKPRWSWKTSPKKARKRWPLSSLAARKRKANLRRDCRKSGKRRKEKSGRLLRNGHKKWAKRRTTMKESYLSLREDWQLSMKNTQISCKPSSVMLISASKRQIMLPSKKEWIWPKSMPFCSNKLK